MSEEQLKAFLKKVKGDTSLQEKLKGAASPDAAVEIAKDAGFAITAITIFFFAITIIGPHTTVQAQTQHATEAGAIEREREEGWAVCMEKERMPRKRRYSSEHFEEKDRNIRVRCIGPNGLDNGGCDRFFYHIYEYLDKWVCVTEDPI